MAAAGSSRPRVRVDGKFFRLGDNKFYVKGVAYGPFAPSASGIPFAPYEQTAADLAQIRELGANLVRVYHSPPRWLLDLAHARELKVLVDIPWNRHLCFDSESRREEARDAVRQAVRAAARHPAIFAYSVANEIPPDIVRWTGPKQVAAFVDELVGEAKRLDPECLCTFTNFPPTEFVRPRTVDFVCFNVYLHEPRAFGSYLARLQMLADGKPLLLGEFGIDSLREGERRKCDLLSWQVEGAFRGGLAGTVLFTFTDDWCGQDGRPIEDWQMGVTQRDRQPKDSFAVVQRQYRAAPHFPLPRSPKISVVVASYNADRTLPACLDSLERLHYPDYEIILVDDGSTDATPHIASRHPRVRFLRHERNLGLSAARNTGIAAAAGQIVAFTDSDCRADEDWLYYLANDLLNSDFVGIGGPNLLPPDDSTVAAAVMASPGGPAHVMLTDREAEHIPGCNMAFYKWAIEEVGGFDPVFTRAGDDVDFCWRLQQRGYRLGFSPAAFVWHSRRSTPAAYLRQQQGYGEAEALLVRKHPENFNAFGSGIWRGTIYNTAKFGLELQPPVIYHGLFGSAGFQKLYAAQPATLLMLCTTPEYYLLVALPLIILSVVVHPLTPLAIVSLLLPLAVCAIAAAQASLPPKKTEWWSRPLVALLFLLQPIVRGWARYRGRLALRPMPLHRFETLDSAALRASNQPLDEVQYWSPRRIERLSWLEAIMQRLDAKGWTHRTDVGWSEYDIEIQGSRWNHLRLTTVIEEHPGSRQLIRCRLRPAWSLVSGIGMGSLLGLTLVMIGLAGPWRPWSWCLLLVVPAAAWLLRADQRRIQSIAAAFLDELARDRGMTTLRAPEAVSESVSQ